MRSFWIWIVPITLLCVILLTCVTYTVDLSVSSRFSKLLVKMCTETVPKPVLLFCGGDHSKLGYEQTMERGSIATACGCEASSLSVTPFQVIFFHRPTTASISGQVLALSLLNLLFSKFINDLLIPQSRGTFSMPTSSRSLKASDSSSSEHLSSLGFLMASQWLSVSLRDSQWLPHASFVARQPTEQDFPPSTVDTLSLMTLHREGLSCVLYVFRSILGLYLREARRTPPRQPKMSPDIAKCPLGGQNHLFPALPTLRTIPIE